MFIDSYNDDASFVYVPEGRKISCAGADAAS